MIGSNAIWGLNCQYNEAEKIFDMKKHLNVFSEQKKDIQISNLNQLFYQKLAPHRRGPWMKTYSYLKL